MRKTKKKLTLQRETLQQLGAQALRVAGGSHVNPTYGTCPPTQEISVCVTCETMTNCQLSGCICA
ncbi:MAG: hypothetical protein JF614_08860 [Acidobacteria bacterium]|nr:hypothetical protein [Acidobacteriota bacterium]